MEFVARVIKDDGPCSEIHTLIVAAAVTSEEACAIALKRAVLLYGGQPDDYDVEVEERE